MGRDVAGLRVEGGSGCGTQSPSFLEGLRSCDLGVAGNGPMEALLWPVDECSGPGRGAATV